MTGTPGFAVGQRVRVYVPGHPAHDGEILRDATGLIHDYPMYVVRIDCDPDDLWTVFAIDIEPAAEQRGEVT